MSNRSPCYRQPLNLDVSGWLASLYVRVTRYLDIPWEVVYMAIWLFISDLYRACYYTMSDNNMALWQLLILLRPVTVNVTQLRL